MQLTYRITFHENTARFVGEAWSDDKRLYIGTASYTHYGKARGALQTAAEANGALLKWFDGEYTQKADGRVQPAL